MPEPDQNELNSSFDRGQELMYYGSDEISKESDDQFNDGTEVMHIKPVKTNKARMQAVRIKPGSIVTQTIQTSVDGAQLIRIKRIFNEPKPMKVCEICGNQYKYQHALDSHMRRHRNEKPFECELVFNILCEVFLCFAFNFDFISEFVARDLL